MAFAEIEGSSGSPFEQFLKRTFDPDLDPRFPSRLVARGVFLCFVNRSGSNFLAECLASSGEIPRAREHFLPSNLVRQPGSSLSRVFEAIVRKHSRNGWFAAKLGFSQFEFFESRGFFNAAFERTEFLLLERRDILAQAISLDIASQNRQWKSDDSTSGDTAPPQYSRKRLELKQEGIREKYARFENLFARNGLDRFRIHYEDLVMRPAETVAEIGKFLKFPLRFEPAKVQSHRTSGDLKEAWRRRFLAGE